MPTSTRQQVNSLLEEIKHKNENVRTKKDKLKWILISYIIIVSIIYVSVPVYLRHKYLRDNDLSYNINNDTVYCDVSFDKGKVVDIQNEKNANGNITSKYIYEMTNGEKIEIQDYNKDYGKTYNICIKKYYKKIQINYLKQDIWLETDSNVVDVLIDATNYVYDYISKKMYKFNSLNNDNIVDFETQIYYREIGNPNTLYNFINYNINTLDITNDFDVKEFKNNHYETIQKIDTYTSEYGMCYILKVNYSGKVDYLIYIENQNKTNLNELDAIILNSRIDRTGSFTNKEEILFMDIKKQELNSSIETIPEELEQNFQKWSEGNKYLYGFFKTCYEHNIRTLASCGGHNNKKTVPYISIILDDVCFPYVNNILEEIKNMQNAWIAYNFTLPVFDRKKMESSKYFQKYTNIWN